MSSEDKNLIVKMAYLYVQGGEWYKAIEEYKKLLAMDPEDAHVFNMMGDAYAKKQDDPDAFDAYMTGRALYSKQGNFGKVSSIEKKIQKLDAGRLDLKRRHVFESVTKTLEADRLASEGRPEEAVAYYQKLIQAEPINFSYREKLASLFLENAQVTDALEQLRAIADIHLEAGRLDKAQAMADQMAEMDPEGYDTLKLLGELADRKGDQDTLSRVYDKLGHVAYGAGHFEEARTAIEKAMAAGHQGLKALYAKTLAALKLSAEAKPQFEALLAENPGDEELTAQLLSICEDLKDWPAVQAHAASLAARHPGDAALQGRLARSLVQVGKRDEATQIYLQQAALALKENKVEAVLGSFDRILSYEPDHLDILKKRAELNLKLGRKQEAIAAYKAFQDALTRKKMVEEARRIGIILNKLAGLK
ncbi:MAG TPA: tetratricopeptide repeat protein [bacterium]|nr:tetratricopeptide repeat protein [bacterium]